jgi:hypothetical protein
VGEGVGDGEGETLGVGVGFDVGLAVGEDVLVGEAVLLGEGVGDGEGETLGVGVGVGLPVDEEELDRTYATRNTSKQAHTNKIINTLLLIFYFTHNK